MRSRERGMQSEDRQLGRVVDSVSWRRENCGFSAARLGENCAATRFFGFPWTGCGRLGFGMDWEALVEAAWAARERAYAPYSKFAVGARLCWRRMGGFSRLQRGESFLWADQLCGTGGHRCGGRGGAREFLAVAVVADTGVPISPCGACRQVLAEFGVPQGLWLANRQESCLGVHGFGGTVLHHGRSVPGFWTRSPSEIVPRGTFRNRLWFIRSVILTPGPRLSPSWRAMFRVLQCSDFRNATM